MKRRPSVPELDLLNVFIGRWITEGEAVPEAGQSAAPIVASDVYEWAPGGHFVMHSAYGHIGSMDVGGLEIIGYDASTKQFHTHFFDSQGNVTSEALSHRDNIWTWQGKLVRCTATFSGDGTTLTAHHERLDAARWVPSMAVTLRKIA